MARGKKNEVALTPEEKLAQALVPVEEQPYKVPRNWCWVKLSSLSSLISKGTTPTGGKTAYVPEGVHFLRVENINDDGTISHDSIACVTEEMHAGFLRRSMLEKRDVLVSIAGTLGKTGIVQETDLPLNTNQAVAFIRLKTEAIDERYIKNVIDNPIVQELLLGKTKVTSIPNLTLEIIGDCPIPLAPTAEQQRIVDCIEYLFTKLDEAKEKAQSVLDSFETRKAAILHKAFTGELTAKWRAEHGVQLDTWQSVLFDNCIAKMQNGLAKRAGSNGIPFAVLRLANLSDDGFITDDLRQIVLDEKEQGNYRLMPDDVLMIRVNGSKDNVGKQFLMGDQKDWAFCDHIIRIRYSDGILPAYMVLFSKSDVYRLYVKDNMVSSAGQNTISRKGMAHLAVPVPSPDEQAEIIRILDSLFAKEQQAKEAAEAVLDKIDLLKKSILARAFRGELGTNDPTEESAVELLRGILKGDI